MEFEVGATYEVVSDVVAEDSDCDVNFGDRFVCHRVDGSGSCWSMDVSYNREFLDDGEGWCVARLKKLREGHVVKVSDKQEDDDENE